VACILIAFSLLKMLGPGGIFLFPEPWNMRYVNGQIIVWLSGLIFLLKQACQEKNRLLARSI
jgi:hypothetical protein